MRGYTKEQLEAKGAALANYVFCSNCSLYWHKRAFQKHLRPAPNTPAPKERDIAIIHPAWDRFLGLLVDLAFKHWEEEQEKIRRGERVETGPGKPGATIDWPPPSPDDPELLTVDEAVARLGASREEIGSEFAKNMIPFEFIVPPHPRARRWGRVQAPTAASTGSPEPPPGAGAAVATGHEVQPRDPVKDRHAALLKRRAKLDEQIAAAERELGLTRQRPPPGRPGSRKM